jgi:DNA-binding transcriptional ArsR family regulator
MSRKMDRKSAIEGFSALAQDTRLTAFRYLVSALPDGKNAGEVARHCKVPHNTMSTHLAILERAGLIDSEKDGREVIYSADISGLRALVDFLAKGCCGGRPEICGQVFAGAACVPARKVERIRG